MRYFRGVIHLHRLSARRQLFSWCATHTTIQSTIRRRPSRNRTSLVQKFPAHSYWLDNHSRTQFLHRGWRGQFPVIMWRPGRRKRFPNPRINRTSWARAGRENAWKSSIVVAVPERRHGSPTTGSGAGWVRRTRTRRLGFRGWVLYGRRRRLHKGWPSALFSHHRRMSVGK